MNDENPIYKIILFSLGYPGKTCLIKRYTHNSFEINWIAFIYETKEVTLKNGRQIKVNIWDTSGTETYLHVNKLYIKGSKGIIFLYDITSLSSLNNVISCYNIIKESIPEDAIIALVGNKLDLYDEHCEKTREKGKKTADQHNIFIFWSFGKRRN